MRHGLLGRWRQRTCRSQLRIVRIVGVAGRATESILGLIHGEAGRGGSTGGRGMRDTVGSSWNERTGILRVGNVSVGITLRTKRSTELLKSGVHEVHMRD